MYVPTCISCTALGQKCFNRHKWYTNFLGKFPENREIVGFLKLKSLPFNLKILEILGGKSNLVMRFLVRKVWYTPQALPLSEFWKNAVALVSGNFQNFIEWKALYCISRNSLALVTDTFELLKGVC